MKLVLIDIDNTLLDFDAYIRRTMEEGFAHFGLRPYEPWMYDVFHRENNKLWRQIEEGTLTFPELEKIRWNNVFAALDMDFDGVVFEKYFRTALHESAIPVNGARELLEALRGRYLLAAAIVGAVGVAAVRFIWAAVAAAMIGEFTSVDMDLIWAEDMVGASVAPVLQRYTLLSVLNTVFMVLLAAGGIGTIFYYPILRLWEKYGKRGE